MLELKLLCTSVVYIRFFLCLDSYSIDKCGARLTLRGVMLTHSVAIVTVYMEQLSGSMLHIVTDMFCAMIHILSD